MLSTHISKISGFLAALTVIIFVILILALFHQRFLAIKDVVCRMGETDCPLGVTTILDRVKESSLLLLSQRDLQKQILATGMVDRVEFSFQLPGKLIVATQPPSLSFFVKTAFGKVPPDLVPVGSISAAPSDQLAGYVASMEGKTFQLFSNGSLNQTDTGSEYYLVSHSIPNKEYLSVTFNWLRSLTLSSIKPKAIYFLNDMIILKQNEEPDLIVNFLADPSEIIIALQRLNDAITIKKPTLIDFRYSHPILK